MSADLPFCKVAALPACHAHMGCSRQLRAGPGLTEVRPAQPPALLADEDEPVVVTPHTGYVTEQGARTAWPRMARDVAAYPAGPPIGVVTDPADCPPMAPQ